MEVELKHFKENFSLAVLRIFGTDFYPGPTHAALRQIFAIRRNLRQSSSIFPLAQAHDRGLATLAEAAGGSRFS